MKKKLLYILGWIGYVLAIFFVAISFFWNLFLANGRAKKYLSGKKNYFVEQRYIWIEKLINRIFFAFRIKIVDNNLQFLSNSPSLIVFNHKSNLDGIIMAKLLIKNYRENNGNFRFVIVVKKEVVRVKLFRNILALIDTVYIDRDNIRQQFQLYNTQNNLIKQKTSIVLSPEGTRISEDEFGEFKSGAFKIAFDNMIYIQPVVIYGTLGRMNKNSKNKCKGPIYVNFLKPKKPFDFHMNNIDYFSETLKNEMEKNYFAIKGNIKNKKKNIFN